MPSPSLRAFLPALLVPVLHLACGGGHGEAPPLKIELEGWYITQAVQKLDRSVPLVADRDGVLRVFLRANTGNHAAPAVRVTITGGAVSRWEQTIRAPGGSVPTGFHEDRINSSWNLPIPGHVLAPGAHIHLEVDPADAVPEVAPALRNIQSALDVRRVAPVRITLVPVTQNGLTGEVVGGGRTLESWVARFRAMYPVAEVDVRLGAPLATSANLNPHPHDDHDWTRLIGELEARRAEDQRRGEAGRYYYGVVKRLMGASAVGQTPVQSHVAAGWDDPASYQDTFAHEMGHAMGMAHAPCGLGDPPGPAYGAWPGDPAHARAQLGAAGLDVATLTPKLSPAFRDIMSYCPPYWVSDHTYTFILAYREMHPF